MHTRDEVLPAAERLATAEGMTGEDFLLVRTAALYHDIGFTEMCEGHEKVGAGIARSLLPDFGYQKKQVDVISGMIMATALPQSPRTPLEALLADADLDVLGRSDFLARNVDLRCELAFRGTRLSDQEWYAQQIAFLKKHRYFTQAARDERDAQKAENLKALSQLLEQA